MFWLLSSFLVSPYFQETVHISISLVISAGYPCPSPTPQKTFNDSPLSFRMKSNCLTIIPSAFLWGVDRIWPRIICSNLPILQRWQTHSYFYAHNPISECSLICTQLRTHSTHLILNTKQGQVFPCCLVQSFLLISLYHFLFILFIWYFIMYHLCCLLNYHLIFCMSLNISFLLFWLLSSWGKEHCASNSASSTPVHTEYFWNE